MNGLEQARKQIADCDETIMELLTKRDRLVEDVMDYKMENNLPVFQMGQEEKQNRYWKEKLSDNPYREELFSVFDCIRRNSKRIQAKRLFEENVILLGFMGVGEETVPAYLNTLFAMDVVDTEEALARREGMSRSDIASICGEEYLGQLYEEFFREMQSCKRTAISCSGMISLPGEAVSRLKGCGKVVFLAASPETISQRVEESKGVLLRSEGKKAEAVAGLLEKRKEEYENLADIKISMDGKSILKVCEELMEKLTSEGKK